MVVRKRAVEAFAIAAFVGLSMVSSCLNVVSAQPAPPPAGGAQPEKPTGGLSLSPKQRTYWPTTDFYDPSQLIGKYVYVTKDGRMDFATTRVSTVKGSITTKFQNAAPALKYDFESSDKINVGVPGILDVKYGAQDFMHLELDDISETIIDGPGGDFCKDWPRFKHIRDWDVGDKVFFVDHVLTSHAAYKTGRKQDAGATIGIGSYFSAGGGTALATSEESNVPAIAVNGVPITLSIQIIANGCPRGNTFAQVMQKMGGSQLGVIMTKPVLNKVKPATL